MSMQAVNGNFKFFWIHPLVNNHASNSHHAMNTCLVKLRNHQNFNRLYGFATNVCKYHNHSWFGIEYQVKSTSIGTVATASKKCLTISINNHFHTFQQNLCYLHESLDTPPMAILGNGWVLLSILFFIILLFKLNNSRLFLYCGWGRQLAL
jgi:hypothetical protein